MPTTMDEEQLSTALGLALWQCLQAGMTLPFHVAVIGSNGAMAYFHCPIVGKDAPADCLAQYGEGIATPVNLFVADAQGKAGRLIVTEDGVQFHH